MPEGTSPGEGRGKVGGGHPAATTLDASLEAAAAEAAAVAAAMAEAEAALSLLAAAEDNYASVMRMAKVAGTQAFAAEVAERKATAVATKLGSEVTFEASAKADQARERLRVAEEDFERLTRLEASAAEQVARAKLVVEPKRRPKIADAPPPAEAPAAAPAPDAAGGGAGEEAACQSADGAQAAAAAAGAGLASGGALANGGTVQGTPDGRQGAGEATADGSGVPIVDASGKVVLDADGKPMVAPADPRVPLGGSVGEGGVILDAEGNPLLDTDGNPMRMAIPPSGGGGGGSGAGGGRKAKKSVAIKGFARVDEE